MILFVKQSADHDDTVPCLKMTSYQKAVNMHHDEQDEAVRIWWNHLPVARPPIMFSKA